MPKSCKCILDRLVFKGAMTEKEREKIMRKLKEYKPAVIDLNEVPAIADNAKCKNICEDYADCDAFFCSECGIRLEGWCKVVIDDDGERLLQEYEFTFCPNCGRKIIKEGRTC